MVAQSPRRPGSRTQWPAVQTKLRLGASVIAAEQTREQALVRYHQFSAGHATAFRWMLSVQRLVPRIAPRVLALGLRAMAAKRFVDWSFGHYLEIAHPRFVDAGAHSARMPARTAIAAA